jgi:hypothetical protein
MDEGRIEQLEKMFPDGFIILVPRKIDQTPIPVAMYYSNPKDCPSIDQLIDDIVFALDKDAYWKDPPKDKKDEPSS